MSNKFDRQLQQPSSHLQFAQYENVTLLGPPTMRGAIVFGGSSHPKLVEGMCDRLGMKPGSATLGKFKNGETSVTIRTCVALRGSRHIVTYRTLMACRYIDPQQRCLHRPERK